MSNRSMLEFNHDYCPKDFGSAVDWADRIIRYLRIGDVRQLPKGVTFFNCRYHSEPCPLGEPPRGWDNKQEPQQ